MLRLCGIIVISKIYYALDIFKEHILRHSEHILHKEHILRHILSQVRHPFIITLTNSMCKIQTKS